MERESERNLPFARYLRSRMPRRTGQKSEGISDEGRPEIVGGSATPPGGLARSLRFATRQQEFSPNAAFRNPANLIDKFVHLVCVRLFVPDDSPVRFVPPVCPCRSGWNLERRSVCVQGAHEM